MHGFSNMPTVDRIAYAFDRLRIMPRLLMLWYMGLYSWWISVQVYNAEAGADEAAVAAAMSALAGFIFGMNSKVPPAPKPDITP